ncbi:MAG TPA: alpha/beta hydrolase [Thermoanaerobaculia bacterium]|jgi:pimeloyl-ACP methyl ester carboxylesterase|nr:alpha/beta hydrolase [Thermoanaerobaculia bacterium]
MPEYVELDGMRMWYDRQGAGEALVMLHPGGVDSRAYGPNLSDFASRFTVFLPEQRGHGHTPDVNGEFTYESMADDTIKFIEQVVGRPTLLMGMSDGGVVALLVAKKRPDLVTRLVFVAAVFHHDGWDDGVLQPGVAPPEFMAEGYGKVSPDGKDHYAVIAKKLDAMHANGPTLAVDDLKGLRCRTLAMFGDDDEVRLEHALAFYRSVPDCELAIIPGTSHGLLVEKPTLCDQIMLEFLTRDPVPTMAPRRRA